MTRFLLSLLFATAVSAMWSTQAMAQRDAGAKARGEFGRGFWNSQSQTSTTQNFNYYTQPATTAAANTQQYRSFSYEPMAFEKGDSVVVNRDNVKMMLGSKTLGAVPKDTTFKVIQITDGWLGAEIEIDGQKTKGWVWNRNVRMNQAAEAAPAPAPPAESKG